LRHIVTFVEQPAGGWRETEHTEVVARYDLRGADLDRIGRTHARRRDRVRGQVETPGALPPVDVIRIGDGVAVDAIGGPEHANQRGWIARRNRRQEKRVDEAENPRVSAGASR